ncbi:MAG: hypothetical protein IT454_11455 [Planctomycetes bacterium]|nr:hypothetical protein [Planctomycetota bacterium]
MDAVRTDEFLARLRPHARRAFENAGELALQWHADEVGPEHLLITLMDDAECAAHRVALHAFADPEVIGDEARALAAGIAISGSARTLPFSTRGVRALRAARARAAARRDGAVEVAHLLLAAFGELDLDLREAFEDAGWNPATIEELLGAGGRADVPPTGALFQFFSDDAKRLLSSAAKLARSSTAPSISAAHLFLAALQANAQLERASGMPASRARIALRGRSADHERVAGGPLELDDSMLGYLNGLPQSSDTLELLARFHGDATAGLAQVLARHKLSRALIERARSAFSDPD